MLHRHRMQARDALTNPLEGRVHLAPFKAFWYLSIITIAVLGGIATFSWAAATVALALTLLTLCLGHSIGLHRLLIHRSFECSPALEPLLQLRFADGYIDVEGAGASGRIELLVVVLKVRSIGFEFRASQPFPETVLKRPW